MTEEAALAEAATRLADAKVDSPRREARLLLALAKGAASDLIPRSGAELSAKDASRLQEIVARRAAREPFAYIAGRKEFWSLEFAVGPGVLVPRSESEVIVEELMRAFPKRELPLRICDFGTGSGCLLIAALHEFPNATGIGIECSAEAFTWAEQNLRAHRMMQRATLQLEAWDSACLGTFDAILANPPYIPSGKVMALAPEVARYEPSKALDGGEDGLEAYRALAPRIAQMLRPGGVAFLEIGVGQADAVGVILEMAGLARAQIVPDLAGIARCVVVRQR